MGRKLLVDDSGLMMAADHSITTRATRGMPL
jgi:hypothetical protein